MLTFYCKQKYRFALTCVDSKHKYAKVYTNMCTYWYSSGTLAPIGRFSVPLDSFKHEYVFPEKRSEESWHSLVNKPNQMFCFQVNISSSWLLPQNEFPVFYRHFRDRVTWFEADAVCQFHHAQLATGKSVRRESFDSVEMFLEIWFTRKVACTAFNTVLTLKCQIG